LVWSFHARLAQGVELINEDQTQGVLRRLGK